MARRRRDTEHQRAVLHATAKDFDSSYGPSTEEGRLFTKFNADFAEKPFDNYLDDRLPVRRHRSRPPKMAAVPPALVVPAVETGKSVNRRSRVMYASFVLAWLGVCASVIGYVSEVPAKPPYVYTHPPPLVLESALEDVNALRATGTCSAELDIQARIDVAYLDRYGEHIGEQFRQRPQLYERAARLAEQAKISCAPPADNPTGSYLLPDLFPRRQISVTSLDLVRVEVGQPGVWCTERAIAVSALTATDISRPQRIYYDEEIIVGTPAAAGRGVVC